jgi:hypothetical protein
MPWRRCLGVDVLTSDLGLGSQSPRLFTIIRYTRIGIST